MCKQRHESSVKVTKMAELAIECPPTVEVNTAANRIGTINDTPPPRAESQPNSRIREFLKKHHEQRTPSSRDATESGNSGDEQQRQQANQSPPPNCSICLGRVKSKCFTDSCMHQFCFSCLLEWSKVSFDCIIYGKFISFRHIVVGVKNNFFSSLIFFCCRSSRNVLCANKHSNQSFTTLHRWTITTYTKWKHNKGQSAGSI